MRFLPALLLAALPISTPAQVAQNGDSTTQPAATPGATVLHASAHLVVLDVVVRDKRHQPVHGLKPSDFTVAENGASEKVRDFTEHLPAPPTAQPISAPKLTPGTFTNYFTKPSDGAVNILLIDALNTPQRDQSRLYSQLLNYVRHQPPTGQTAIFALTNSLSMLQGFSSDPKVLEAVLTRKGIPSASPTLTDSARGPGDFEATAFAAEHSDPNDLLYNASIALQNYSKGEIAANDELRTRITLDGLNGIARYLAIIPGRKNIIWFSGSFPISDFGVVAVASKLPGNTGPGSAEAGVSEGLQTNPVDQEQLRDTINLLARSQVAVYPVDARGNFSATGASGMDAVNQGAQYAVRLPIGPNPDPTASNSPGAAGAGLSESMVQRANDHERMNEVASETGGHAIYNTNDLAHAAQEAIDDGSSYYTLTYTPSDSHWNGGFRKIRVKVGDNNYTLSYRTGYYADDPNKSNIGHEHTALSPTNWNPAITASVHGAPLSTQIVLSARLIPASDTAESKEDKPAPDMIFDDPSKNAGPFQTYQAAFAANAANVAFTQLPDGKRRMNLEFVTFVYDSTGKRLAHTTTHLSGDVAPETYLDLLKKGIPARQTISIPAKHATYVRVIVHDLNSNKTGAVEFPSQQLRVSAKDSE